MTQQLNKRNFSNNFHLSVENLRRKNARRGGGGSPLLKMFLRLCPELFTNDKLWPIANLVLTMVFFPMWSLAFHWKPKTRWILQWKIGAIEIWLIDWKKQDYEVSELFQTVFTWSIVGKMLHWFLVVTVLTVYCTVLLLVPVEWLEVNSEIFWLVFSSWCACCNNVVYNAMCGHCLG